MYGEHRSDACDRIARRNNDESRFSDRTQHGGRRACFVCAGVCDGPYMRLPPFANGGSRMYGPSRSEEHTSELQSRSDLVCRLLLEKKKKNRKTKSANIPRARSSSAQP